MPQELNADTGACLKIVAPEAFLLRKLREALALFDLPAEVGIRAVDFGTENDLSLELYVKKGIKLDAAAALRIRLAGPRTIRLSVLEAEIEGVSVRGLADKALEAFPGLLRTVGPNEYEYDLAYPFVKLAALNTDGAHLVVFGDVLLPELMQFLKSLAPS